MKKITDKQRLDWMEKRGNGTVNFTPQTLRGIYVWEMGWREFPKGMYFKTLRQAIDSAIRSSNDE